MFSIAHLIEEYEYIQEILQRIHYAVRKCKCYTTKVITNRVKKNAPQEFSLSSLLTLSLYSVLHVCS
jgi:hypothetical protein